MDVARDGGGTMKGVKLKGPFVTAVVAALAMAGVIGAFVGNASPYVTIAQARKMGGDALNLGGFLDKKSVYKDFSNGHLTFQMKDMEGATIRVEYAGAPPPSLMDCERLVAVGAMHGDRFVARDLLVKCPSKYDTKERDPLASRS